MRWEGFELMWFMCDIWRCDFLLCVNLNACSALNQQHNWIYYWYSMEIICAGSEPWYPCRQAHYEESGWSFQWWIGEAERDWQLEGSRELAISQVRDLRKGWMCEGWKRMKIWCVSSVILAHVWKCSECFADELSVCGHYKTLRKCYK
jgi:hypothetical protein